MTGFEYAQTFNSVEGKVAVLLVDAAKHAFHKAGLDFDSLTTEEKIRFIEKFLNN